MRFYLILLLFTSTAYASDSTIQTAHALALYGAPRYGADFEHFDYVNPEAPKGGTIRLAAIGTYDNLNPFVLKGCFRRWVPADLQPPVHQITGRAFHRACGQLAARMHMPEDRSWVLFELREEARWHDGEPVTAEDVVFSFNALVEWGIPFIAAFTPTSRRSKHSMHAA